MLDASIIKRLVFIKYMQMVGNDQSMQPEPTNSISVLTWHDSLELFLHLSCVYLDAGKPPKIFMEYWPIINKSLKDSQHSHQLSQQEPIRRLVRARRELKHHGMMPAKADLEVFRVNVDNFFQENTQYIFGVHFRELSLVDLVESENIREWLNKALQSIKDSDPEAALCSIAVAFRKLIEGYEKSKDTGYIESPFSIIEDFTWDDFYLSEFEEGEKLITFFDKIKKSFESIEKPIKIILLGLDYRKYSKFIMHVPHVSLKNNAPIQYTWPSRVLEPTIEASQFCFNYVVDSALHMQEFDYQLPRLDSVTGLWKLT